MGPLIMGRNLVTGAKCSSGLRLVVKEKVERKEKGEGGPDWTTLLNNAHFSTVAI